MTDKDVMTEGADARNIKDGEKLEYDNAEDFGEPLEDADKK